MSTRYISIFLVILLTSSIALSSLGKGEAATLASLYINPPEITGLNVGDTFTINISVSNIVNLAGWQFVLFYSTKVVSAIEVAEGPFLKSSGANTYFIHSPSPAGIWNEYNSTHGRVYLACATYPATGVNGGGTLATVTFQVVGVGTSALIISEELGTSEHPEETKLLDNTPADPQRIPNKTKNSLVKIIANDVAITQIGLSKTIVNDTQVIINVTAANLGNFTVSFDVTVNYSSTEISTQTVTNLAPSISVILQFPWNTSTVPKGNYTISARAQQVIGEQNTANNFMVGGWIMETILGDVNGDHQVDIVDVTGIAICWEKTPEDEGWNPNADMDNNNLIDIIDITTVAVEFGRTDF